MPTIRYDWISTIMSLTWPTIWLDEDYKQTAHKGTQSNREKIITGPEFDNDLLLCDINIF